MQIGRSLGLQPGGKHELRSPFELDFEFPLVVLDLDLELEVNLVGTCTLKCMPPRSNSMSLCLASASAIACRRAAASSRVSRSFSVISIRSIRASLLMMLAVAGHGRRRFAPVRRGRPGCPREPWPRARRPGCLRAMRTRRTPGRMRNRSGGSSMSASPSIPAGTGRSASTSNSGADHSRHGRCSERPLSPRPEGAPTTATPSRPSSIRGRVGRRPPSHCMRSLRSSPTRGSTPGCTTPPTRWPAH